MSITLQKLKDLHREWSNESLPMDVREKALEKYRRGYDRYEKAKQATRATYPHFFFKPNPPQAKFLKMINEGVLLRKHYDFAATFGTWVGKTTCLAVIMANICQTVDRMANAFKGLPLFTNWPYEKRIRLVCAPDQMNELTGAVWNELSKWLPHDNSWQSLKAAKHYPSVIKLPNGWVVDIKTHDQSGEGKESADIGLFLFDEPPPLDDWHRAAGRRKHGGLRIIFGSFIEDSGEQPALFEDIMADPNVEYFFASTEENFKSNIQVIEPFGECRGYLDDEITKSMMASWPEHQREARRTGRPNIMQSAVFKMQPDVHFVPRSTVPKELTSYLALDPHDVRPGVIVVGGWDKDGSLWIIDEWPSIGSHQRLYTNIQTDDMGNKQYADLINSLRRKHGISLNIIDSNFADTAYHHETASTTLRRELWNHGRLQFINGIKDVIGKAGGIARVRELLEVHETPRGKRAKLYIVDDLSNCREGMTRLKRKRLKDELTGRVSDELEDRFLDYPRCIMYLAMHRRGYQPVETVPVTRNEYGHNKGSDFEEKHIERISSMNLYGGERVEGLIEDLAIA